MHLLIHCRQHSVRSQGLRVVRLQRPLGRVSRLWAVLPWSPRGLEPPDPNGNHSEVCLFPMHLSLSFKMFYCFLVIIKVIHVYYETFGKC